MSDAEEQKARIAHLFNPDSTLNRIGYLLDKFVCLIFARRCYFQQNVNLGNDRLVVAPEGFPCNDEIQYIRSFCKASYSMTEDIDTSELVKQCVEHTPVSVLEVRDIEAADHVEALGLALDRAQTIFGFVAWYQMQAPEIFGYAILVDGKIDIQVFTSTTRKPFHLTDNVQRFASYCTKQMVTDDRLKLYINLFNEANRETNPLFRFVKFWTQLETMALQYEGRKDPKMKKVRALFEHFRISTGDKTYNGHDYLRVAYEIRKKVAHEGNIEIRKDDPSWLRQALRESSQILNWLGNSTAFLIRRYIAEKAAQALT